MPGAGGTGVTGALREGWERALQPTLPYQRLAWVVALGKKVKEGMRRPLEASEGLVGVEGGGPLGEAVFPPV